MATEQIGNLASTTLASAILATDTTLVVASSAGFPNVPFRAVLSDGSTSELIKVTAVAGTTWTVTRGIEGTTAAAWATGDNLAHILTAGALKQRAQDLMLYGTVANRPAAGDAGRIFYASDTLALYRDNGMSWDLLTPVGATMGASVTRTTNFSVPNAVGTAVIWNSTIRDDGSPAFFNNGQPTRLTAPVTGWYLVGAYAKYTSGTTGELFTDLRINGTNFVGGANAHLPGTALEMSRTIATALYLTAGDYVELISFQTTGAAHDLYSFSRMYMVRMV